MGGVLRSVPPQVDPSRAGRIVIGVDGSPESQAALCWAIGHAEARGLPVRVVTAWSAVHGSLFDSVHPENDPAPLMTAETVLARAVAEAGVPVGDRTVTTVRVPGRPAHAACPVALVRRPAHDKVGDLPVAPGMRVGTGMLVDASDGTCGEVADIVVDPRRRSVTHLVMRSGHRFGVLRLVPVGAVVWCADHVVLSWSTTQVEQAVRVEEVGVLDTQVWPHYQDGWDIGLVRGVTWRADDVLGRGGSMPGPPLPWGEGPALGPLARFDRIPAGSAEVRHASTVLSSDDHVVGHLGGLVLGADHAITGVVLDRGHLLARRDITVPVRAVASVATDLVRLRLARADLGSFPSAAAQPPRRRTG